jgi:hypothetical protein
VLHVGAVVDYESTTKEVNNAFRGARLRSTNWMASKPMISLLSSSWIVVKGAVPHVRRLTTFLGNEARHALTRNITVGSN